MAVDFDRLNWETRMANGSIDTRDGAYDSGERGYYERSGVSTPQYAVDRHNDYVFRHSNGDYPDRLYGNSAVRTRETVAETNPHTTKSAKRKRRLWFW